MQEHLLAIWYFLDTHFTFPGSCCSCLGCSPCQFSAHPNHSAFQSPVQMPFSSLLVIVSPPPELLSSISCYHWLSMLQALRHVIASPNKKPEAHVGQNSWHVAWSIKCAEQRAEYNNCHVISCGTGGRGGRSSHGLKWYRKWDCDHRGWKAWGRIALYGLFLCRCDQTPWPRQLMDRVLLEFTVLESTVARAASLQVADRLTSWKLSHPQEERRNRDVERKIGSQWSTSFSKMALLKLPQTVPPTGGQVIKASSLLAFSLMVSHSNHHMPESPRDTSKVGILTAHTGC